MRYLFLFLSFIIFPLPHSMAQEDPTLLALAVAEKMQKVEKYSADVLINIDVDFINIEARKARVFFEKPDKFEIKAKGIALLPKKGAEMEYLGLLNQEFLAINQKSEEIDGIQARVIKVIPNDPDQDIVLAQLWIDEENLRILKIQTYTKTSGSYKVFFGYADNPFDLPSSIRVEFDVKDMSLPASMTGDLEDLSKKLDKKGITTGIVILEYSNYIVN